VNAVPTISVLVPIYKSEAYLDRCIKSILNQTFTDFELILVDDGSPDNCPQMCDEWAKKDSRIKVIHQQNHGVSYTRNVALDYVFQNSNSQWIIFVDSDDWVHKCYLAALYSAATKNTLKISACLSLKTTDKDLIVDENNMKDYFSAGACGIGIGSGIVKKKMIDDNKFEEITALAKLYTSKL
jgi:glycosyltransferase involved in cell wall biosynthesis